MIVFGDLKMVGKEAVAAYFKVPFLQFHRWAEVNHGPFLLSVIHMYSRVSGLVRLSERYAEGKSCVLCSLT